MSGVERRVEDVVRRYRALMKSAHTLKTEAEVKSLKNTFDSWELLNLCCLLRWQTNGIMIALVCAAAFLAGWLTLLTARVWPTVDTTATFTILVLVLAIAVICLYIFKFERKVSSAVNRRRTKHLDAWLKTERWEDAPEQNT